MDLTQKRSKILYVALTFDDGYLQHYQVANLLRRIGIRASFFIVTHLRIYQDKPLLAMKPKLIQEIYEMGHEIGSHTCTHPDLTSIPAHQIEEEIKRSKEWLENIVGDDIAGFAYPYGVYNYAILNIVSKYYKYARGTGNFEDRWNTTIKSRYMIGAMGMRHIFKLPFKMILRKGDDIKLVLMLHNESLHKLLMLIRSMKTMHPTIEFITLKELVDIL
jgi:peptidoglycan/xylan/chitin deacetylase (PgdA/CDA1 family)